MPINGGQFDSPLFFGTPPQPTTSEIEQYTDLRLDISIPSSSCQNMRLRILGKMDAELMEIHFDAADYANIGPIDLYANGGSRESLEEAIRSAEYIKVMDSPPPEKPKTLFAAITSTLLDFKRRLFGTTHLKAKLYYNDYLCCILALKRHKGRFSFDFIIFRGDSPLVYQLSPEQTTQLISSVLRLPSQITAPARRASQSAPLLPPP